MTDQNSTHTPGPWRVYTNGNMENRLAIQADGPTVARIDTVETIADIRLKSVTDLPAEANADLMAAAPELLEALERLVALLRDQRLDGNLAPIRNGVIEAVELGRAAIEKAR